ncbi:hypothetical protein HPB52_009774 [Rhipicephalus sanguineus]|uniref:Uncharacterized protein n=1 Tax=Rhipicephalus sanguineus TaxID=34632 RepID=A0A9D4QDC5_RHISA|nr:hypothetical protein HPB52_009774 [Rhipicephalus sanguineus]
MNADFRTLASHPASFLLTGSSWKDSTTFPVMDKRHDKHQPLSPAETPHDEERSPDDSEDRHGVARDVAEGRERRPDVDSSSRRRRHQRGVAAQWSDVGRDGSPIPAPLSTAIVERRGDIVPYDQQASWSRHDSEENAAATKRDVARARALRKAEARRDLRMRAAAQENDKYEHSTSSFSSELRSADMPPKEKRETRTKVVRSRV